MTPQDKELILSEDLKRERMRQIREKFGINVPKKGIRRLKLDKDI